MLQNNEGLAIDSLVITVEGKTYKPLEMSIPELQSLHATVKANAKSIRKKYPKTAEYFSVTNHPAINMVNLLNFIIEFIRYTKE